MYKGLNLNLNHSKLERKHDFVFSRNYAPIKTCLNIIYSVTYLDKFYSVSLNVKLNIYLSHCKCIHNAIGS